MRFSVGTLSIAHESGHNILFRVVIIVRHVVLAIVILAFCFLLKNAQA